MNYNIFNFCVRYRYMLSNKYINILFSILRYDMLSYSVNAVTWLIYYDQPNIIYYNIINTYITI